VSVSDAYDEITVVARVVTGRLAGRAASAVKTAHSIAVVMSAAGRRAFAEAWFLAGFAASGRGFHGETYDVARYPALRELLITEFERRWFGQS
jgi:hypothetical protein